MSDRFTFDPERLQALAETRRAEYVAARPFAHAVIDDFLPEPVLKQVLAEFPSLSGDAWSRFEGDHERKLASRDEGTMGDTTRHLLAELNSAAFIDFLATLTGIAGLVPDPHLVGGGLHQIVPGGFLDVHVDFNRHPLTRLDRRLNALVYLNRDWDDEYGGALELWSAEARTCERRILPLFNRLVVFSTTEHSFHGHPEPLRCPADRTRKSLALYYYSRGRPEEGGEGAPGHNTQWLDQPQPRQGLRSAVRLLAPPALLDTARRARRRHRA